MTHLKSLGRISAVLISLTLVATFVPCQSGCTHSPSSVTQTSSATNSNVRSAATLGSTSDSQPKDAGRPMPRSQTSGVSQPSDFAMPELSLDTASEQTKSSPARYPSIDDPPKPVDQGPEFS